MAKNKIISIGFFVGILLIPRIYRLEQIPPHLSNDEISIAYDAYSIAITGRDEHNHPLPVSFLSNGIYKAPLYSYMLAPIVLGLGNTNVAARLPSVIAGFITIVGIFILTGKFAANKTIGWFAAGALLISPWHIVVSRMVLESNLALMFVVWGLVLFFRGNRILSSLFLGLSMYAYHTEWILVPIIGLFLAIKFKTKIFILMLFLMMIPLGFDYWNHLGSGSRANTEVIWKDPLIEAEMKKETDITGKSVSLVKAIAINYFQYTNPGRLFGSGLGLFDEPSPFQQGLFVVTMIIPMFLGIKHIKKYIKLKFLGFFALWFLTSTGIAALTTRGNHIRDLTAVVPYAMLLGIGINRIYEKSKTGFLILATLTLGAFGFFNAIYQYYYPKIIAGRYQGYRPIAEFIQSNSEKYTQFVIDDRFGNQNQYSGVPHLYLAYYSRLDPGLLQHRKTGGNYGKINVRTICWKSESITENKIYVVGSGNTPAESVRNKLIKKMELTDFAGNPAFEIWESIDD